MLYKTNSNYVRILLIERAAKSIQSIVFWFLIGILSGLTAFLSGLTAFLLLGLILFLFISIIVVFGAINTFVSYFFQKSFNYELTDSTLQIKPTAIKFDIQDIDKVILLKEQIFFRIINPLYGYGIEGFKVKAKILENEKKYIVSGKNEGYLEENLKNFQILRKKQLFSK